jgi:hypothetical protein
MFMIVDLTLCLSSSHGLRRQHVQFYYRIVSLISLYALCLSYLVFSSTIALVGLGYWGPWRLIKVKKVKLLRKTLALRSFQISQTVSKDSEAKALRWGVDLLPLVTTILWYWDPPIASGARHEGHANSLEALKFVRWSDNGQKCNWRILRFACKEDTNHNYPLFLN